MATVLLLHHAQGRTPGVEAFAQRLRDAGHTVEVPDVYDGATFDTVDEGVAHARDLGFDQVQEAGVASAEGLPTTTVYAGMSLGAMAAQKLAQQRSGAGGLLLYHGGAPMDTFGASWPDGVPVQAHVMADDDWGDVDVLTDLVEQVDDGELFTYDGDAHLFTDASLDVFDEDATDVVVTRTLAFLDRVDAS